jgi:hypothetical protein
VLPPTSSLDIPGTPKPAPWVVTPEELEVPAGLPQLSFPSSPEGDLAEKATERRHQRYRTEAMAAVLILAISVGGGAYFHNITVLALCVIALGAVVLYEVLVSNFE